jgi:S1-C subfamily serine protease
MDIYSTTIIDALAKITNAVVKIDVYKKRGEKNAPVGSGSGFIFSSDGLLFTNNHVISSADSINVVLPDGSEFKGEPVGNDKDSDIAIAKIYGSGYSVAKLGNSTDLKIGQLVIAIGNPLGYQQSVSAGILSGMGRTMRGVNGVLIDNVIQSDVSLNPGNSGGPMINTDGEVIGINTAVIQGAQGISFTIGIDSAKEIADQLIKFGKVTKAYIGLMLQDIEINPRLRNFYQLTQSRGLLIIGTENASPAERADLHEGDILIEFDGKPLKSSIDLIKLLNRDKIFNPTPLKIIRKGQLMDIHVFPVEKPAAYN